MSKPDHHATLHADFRWSVPEKFNIAEMCLHRWARDTPAAVAILQDGGNEPAVPFTYASLQRDAHRLSNALGSLGVTRGDRVAIVMPQRPQTAVALMAVFQMGAIAVPLSVLFGAEALQSRLVDSGAKVAIVDEASADAIEALREACPALLKVMGAGAADSAGDISWSGSLAAARDEFEPTDTRADDPALLIYTSGTTGAAKGAVIPHRALIGNLSGFVASQNWFDGDGPFWSPADWAWTGGLWDALLPTLYFGRTIVASRARFDADLALKLMERHRVTHTFLFPTALKAMMRVAPEPRTSHPKLALRCIMSAGEAVGEGVFAYCRDKLGIVVNEMFGQTEMNYVVGNCGQFRSTSGRRVPGWPPRAGSMGRPYPGHRIAVIDDDGNECPRGTAGDIAVHARDVHGDRDPIFFLGYWNNERATHAKFAGAPFESWCRTGDRAVMDDDGYLWYQGRSDDQFKTSGYRVGPTEIEDCLARHPAVAQVAVVPKPDAERGAVVKAFVIAAVGVVPDAALVDELQQLVRSRLAPYETPKDIEFVDALPMTATGKLQRNVLRQLEIDRAAGKINA
ncbi:acyl-CoA synthetase [Scleromatobacter humisilvae]|uniref:AMP-binding protein n=1 Tax=Scleromatobacter humisilvae TaxID=2897159 RepID=A0A9X1YMW7_9BURK|nr:AMP-binding protein [Scleromatobacter humisilvae]MCK9684471.1 AMP-binding protein [Scleromatobacter humisilvae]